MEQTHLKTKGLYDPCFEHDACGIGFVAHLKGDASHDIVLDALTVLRNLDHRGARGAEADVGDGAGILVQIPDAFLRHQCEQMGIELPARGDYAVGMIFLPRDDRLRETCEAKIEQIVAETGLPVLGWRTVPTDDTTLGKTARDSQPFIRQLIVGKPEEIEEELAFERRLFVARKRCERAAKHAGGKPLFYFASFSSRTVVYKGMLTPEQLADYYLDLGDPTFASAIALVHSRFSTNTFPSWERAHPYRYMIHNGEINTLRGNVNWFRAREAMCRTDVFGVEISELLPVLDEDGSDSQIFDNCLEFLHLCGRSLPHAAMMMVPEPWVNHVQMDDEKKAFYEYHSTLMEPWDGPAAIVFTDGTVIGAILDRNGLRPARYCVTSDDRIVLASETGVLPIDPAKIIRKDRLQPGRMLLVDTREGRIVSDEEVKRAIVRERPYRQWLDENLVRLDSLPKAEPDHGSLDDETRLRWQKAFGYTYEDLVKILEPMAKTGVEPVGSMGVDTPLAVFSERPQLLYNYFKQLFAQVTNPPIDAIREEIVTSTVTTIGPEGNLVRPGPENCRKIRLETPVLNAADFAKLKRNPLFKTETLPILFPVEEGEAGLERAMERLFAEADRAIENGVQLLILSDRGVDERHAPIPALLAVSGLHHHLIRNGKRMKVGIALESGEPREVHHFAMLLGYGAEAIYPYLALESVRALNEQQMVPGEYEKLEKNYLKAVVKGVVKIASKMGISTLQSYRGAQIFEAIGIHRSVIDKYFTWTPSRIGGVGLDAIAKETLMRHGQAYAVSNSRDIALDPGGDHQWRAGGEVHLLHPETIHTLQQAARTNNYALYKKFANLIDDQSRQHITLRSLFKFRQIRDPVPIEEVEPVESICRRFKTGGMSFGSISKEAHESLAIAMNRIGGKSNTGEGGEDPERFKDERRSAIKQVASGRFGVTIHYLVNSDEIQIKIAQGAKPGEGGQLPGKKVYPWIAECRGTTAGVGLISPPPHHDIYSIEDLAELIFDLKNANPRAKINVKLVSAVGVGTIAAGVAKGRADVILISGYDGGTGASPRSSIKHAGLPWELGLAETHQTLLLNGLRDRVVLETDGKLMTGRDVVIAALLGAEEYGFSTAPLIVLGCVMMRVCHLDTCPVGVATQNPELRKRFTGDPDHVVNYMRFVAQDVREWMAKLGFRTIDEMVGRTDVLEVETDHAHWKMKGLDLSPLLYQPDVPPHVGRCHRVDQNHRLEETLDSRELMRICRPALEEGKRVHAILPIRNTDRSVGTMVGSELTRRYGRDGLPHDTIRLHFNGSAGQSFGAFVPKGMTLSLEGDANDYFGKGLSGGKLIVFPPPQSPFVPEDNIIIGNVALYGASGGEAYIRGRAGERFCVRNSGARAVVEGVGDHGCEYMTGGRVVIIGPTGRNFAAGMSGGIAYVLDEDGRFRERANDEMVLFELLEDEYEIEEVKLMLQNHVKYTGSEKARRILHDWNDYVVRFVKVIPRDYKRMFESIERAKREGLSQEEAVMRAFIENTKDVSRVSGN